MCNCGKKSVLTIFEIVVINGIAIYLVYISVAMFGHCIGFYLKRKEKAIQIQKQKEKAAKKRLIDEIELKRCSTADAGSVSTSSL